MARELPSLNAIRFFECAARHRSFTKAADELCVTQGAVSRQIKLLEQQLNCQLFSRKGPYLQLTTHGTQLQETITTSFDIIRHGIARLRQSTDSTLTISVLPSFVSRWLLPKLPEFELREPTLSVHLAASYIQIDFSVNTDIDAAIRLGSGNWPGLHALQLTNDRMFPVCSPKIAKKIKTINDLADYTIFFDKAPHDEWKNWFKASKHPYIVNTSKLFDDTGMQIKAAIDGQGISLVREELVNDLVGSGVLVRLFDIDFISSMHYYFVYPVQRVDESKIQRFHHWLLDVRDCKEGE